MVEHRSRSSARHDGDLAPSRSPIRVVRLSSELDTACLARKGYSSPFNPRALLLCEGKNVAREQRPKYEY